MRLGDIAVLASLLNSSGSRNSREDAAKLEKSANLLYIARVIIMVIPFVIFIPLLLSQAAGMTWGGPKVTLPLEAYRESLQEVVVTDTTGTLTEADLQTVRKSVDYCGTIVNIELCYYFTDTPQQPAQVYQQVCQDERHLLVVVNRDKDWYSLNFYPGQEVRDTFDGTWIHWLEEEAVAVKTQSRANQPLAEVVTQGVRSALKEMFDGGRGASNVVILAAYLLAALVVCAAAYLLGTLVLRLAGLPRKRRDLQKKLAEMGRQG